LLIGCEGRITEPLYFRAIRGDLRLPTERVLIVRPDGSDPLKVVEAVIDARQEQKAKRAWLQSDQAWTVFDGDEHRLSDPQRWNKALQLAEAREIRLAVSNPSFELWLLLHFRDHAANATPQEVLRLLRQEVPDYDKATCLYPDRLKQTTTQAIERARSLGERARDHTTAPHPNPSSGVGDLVAELFSLRT
jgi:hypothetical protein